MFLGGAGTVTGAKYLIEHQGARILIEVGTEPMFLLLIAAGLVYLLMGDAGEALVLLGFVLAIMGITIARRLRCCDRPISFGPSSRNLRAALAWSSPFR